MSVHNLRIVLKRLQQSDCVVLAQAESKQDVKVKSMWNGEKEKEKEYT